MAALAWGPGPAAGCQPLVPAPPPASPCHPPSHTPTFSHHPPCPAVPCAPLHPSPRSVAIFIGPAAGAAMAPVTAALASLGTVGACAAYTLLILPESLSPGAKAAVGLGDLGGAWQGRQGGLPPALPPRLVLVVVIVLGRRLLAGCCAGSCPAFRRAAAPLCSWCLPASPARQARLCHAQHHHQDAAPGAPGSPGGSSGGGGGGGGVVALSTLRAARILLRSPLFKRLTLCMMLTGVVSEGLQDLLVQYLKLKMEFGVADVVRRLAGVVAEWLGRWVAGVAGL